MRKLSRCEDVTRWEHGAWTKRLHKMQSDCRGPIDIYSVYMGGFLKWIEMAGIPIAGRSMRENPHLKWMRRFGVPPIWRHGNHHIGSPHEKNIPSGLAISSIAPPDGNPSHAVTAGEHVPEHPSNVSENSTGIYDPQTMQVMFSSPTWLDISISNRRNNAFSYELMNIKLKKQWTGEFQHTHKLSIPYNSSNL